MKFLWRFIGNFFIDKIYVFCDIFLNEVQFFFFIDDVCNDIEFYDNEVV